MMTHFLCFSQDINIFFQSEKTIKTLPFILCVLFQHYASFQNQSDFFADDNNILMRGLTLAAVQLEPRISFKIFLSTNCTASQVSFSFLLRNQFNSETECFIAWNFKYNSALRPKHFCTLLISHIYLNTLLLLNNSQ